MTKKKKKLKRKDRNKPLLKEQKKVLAGVKTNLRFNIEDAGHGLYSQQILACLEKMAGIMTQRPYQVFYEWVGWVEAALALMPQHLNDLVASRLTPDPNSQVLAWLYDIARVNCPVSGYVNRSNELWDLYIRAFQILVDGSRPGLWTYNNANEGYLGPDILADVYLAYSQQDPQWEPYDLMGYCALVEDAKTRIHDGEKQVLAKLKEALLHRDNSEGQKLLRRSLPDDKPETVESFLLKEAIPLAMPFYEPVTLMDAWAGTGARILAMASLYPDWAVLHGLVKFVATEPDPLVSLMCSATCYLYGINGYFSCLYNVTIPEDQNIQINTTPDLFTIGINGYRWSDHRRPPQVFSSRSNGHAGPSFAGLFQNRVINPSTSYVSPFLG